MITNIGDKVRKTAIALGMAAAIATGCAARNFRNGIYEMPYGDSGCTAYNGRVSCWTQLSPAPVEGDLRLHLLESANTVKRVWFNYSGNEVEIYPAADPSCERKLGYYGDWCRVLSNEGNPSNPNSAFNMNAMKRQIIREGNKVKAERAIK